VTVEPGQLRMWQLTKDNWDLKDRLQGKVFLVLTSEPKTGTRISVPAWLCLMDGVMNLEYQYLIEENSVVVDERFQNGESPNVFPRDNPI